MGSKWSLSEETRKKQSEAQKRRWHGDSYEKRKAELQSATVKRARVRGRYGREPVSSPYVPELFVVFKSKANRWYCSARGRPGSTTHARAVYEYHYGYIPDGFHVHHCGGDTSSLESDRLENLLLVPALWNVWFFPILSRGFNVAESEITRLYKLAVVKFPLETYGNTSAFREICRRLLSENS